MGCVQSAIQEFDHINSKPRNGQHQRQVQAITTNHQNNSQNLGYSQQYQTPYPSSQANYQYSTPPLQQIAQPAAN